MTDQTNLFPFSDAKMESIRKRAVEIRIQLDEMAIDRKRVSQAYTYQKRKLTKELIGCNHVLSSIKGDSTTPRGRG